MDPARARLLRRRSTRTGHELDPPSSPADDHPDSEDEYAVLSPSHAGKDADPFAEQTFRAGLLRVSVIAMLSIPILWSLLAILSHYRANSAPTRPQGPQKRLVGNCTASTFTSALPSNAVVENVTAVPDGGSFGEGTANLWSPVNPTDLPPLCAVIVNVTSSPSSSYRVGMFLPAEQGRWNRRMLTLGNGGFGGGIGWLFMGSGAHQGFAVVATDTGHNSNSTDLTWAFNEPEKRTDWAWRSLHGSVGIGRRVVEAFYGEGVGYSYYSGCSTGGRQGLKEMQMFPESFDGVLVGAPAWFTTHTNTYAVKQGTFLYTPDDPRHLPANLFAAIGKDVIKQCDADDGVTDGIISLPDRCKPNLEGVRCGRPGANESVCVTDAQMDTVRRIYAPWRCGDDNNSNKCPSAFPRIDDTLLHPGLLPGSEGQWNELYNRTTPSPYGRDYARYFVYGNATWEWTLGPGGDEAALVRDAERLDTSGATADDFSAAAFRQRGGKLVLYHGDADGLVPTLASDLYRDRTLASIGDDAAAGFARFFRVPGMQHCGGTVVDAPWAFGAWAQSGGFLGTNGTSVPGFADAEHDVLLALVDWVEKGVAVDRVVATTWNEPRNVSSGVKRQRPLCAWPRRAVWDGVGDVDVAGSWGCRGEGE